LNPRTREPANPRTGEPANRSEPPNRRTAANRRSGGPPAAGRRPPPRGSVALWTYEDAKVVDPPDKSRSGFDADARPDLPGPGRRRAASIYGTIITAAVIAAGGGRLTTGALAVTVLVTLVVYWLAEQYAELLGEHTHAGRLPGPAQVRTSLGAAWPMVTASFVPLACLLLARLFGASTSNAAWVALLVTVALLVVHGYAAGRAAGLAGLRLLLVAGTAGLLGVVMVVLKTLLQHHHYH
jgi:hypothetical protein